jgi:type II secretory pathway predicted ATPase ExeA
MTAPQAGMDLAFFGLDEPAFNPTPDPRFLHLTPGHSEALAQLLYGVQQKKGFVLLTGEVGTGKTTLLNALLNELGDGTAVAFVTNPMLGFEGVIEYMVEDLGITKPEDTSFTKRLVAFQNFLIERSRTGQNTVLIMDEAHELGAATLERIRLLSNFETPTEKLLQVVLAGQTELRTMLELPELRSLKQRIGISCEIPPLTREEVGPYVRRRLAAAGAPDARLFSPEAIARIAAYSGGIPRVVNTVCDHSLLFAYADQVRRVTPDTVEEVVRYLDHGKRTSRWRRPALPRWLTWRRSVRGVLMP